MKENGLPGPPVRFHVNWWEGIGFGCWSAKQWTLQNSSVFWTCDDVCVCVSLDAALQEPCHVATGTNCTGPISRTLAIVAKPAAALVLHRHVVLAGDTTDGVCGHGNDEADDDERDSDGDHGRPWPCPSLC